ncbi:type II secretion system secretin GspD [Loktanella sp. IMCC34160]|uniref:type II secretion system secretin GspD n=1 Tax=Loktanella sp. IMCC34160 TaxID=2510646 RepID=UPI001A9262A8|nr:type II secretion system secretin GspD [Loktanella sp. IMCC34160]
MACIAVLVSCTEGATTSSGRYRPDVTRSGEPGTGGGPGGQRWWGQDRSPVSRGNDTFINEDALRADAPGRADIRIVDDSLVEITLINASIQAAAEAILSETLGRSYVVAEDVSGRVTIQSTGPIPKSALLQLFEASLDANGARIEVDGDVLSIRSGSSGNRTFRTVGQAGIDGSTIVVAPLHYISASQMVNLLGPLVEEGLRVVPDQNRNLLLLSGGAAQLNAAVDALNLFDVDVMRGKSIALVTLEAADPEDVVEELKAIFEAREGGLLEGVIEFIPNNRLNSVLIITSRSAYLDDAQRWIRDLDRSAGRSQRYTRIYPLQNRRAAEIAPILDQLMVDVRNSEGDEGASSSAGSRIAADPERNALVVRGVMNEHAEVERLLVDLDSRAQQVALEATIAEVTLNDEVNLGVRWFFEQNATQTSFSDAKNGGISQNFPGFSSLFSSGDTTAVLNALAGVTDVRVISSPTLVVLDNKEAVLQIGDQVPVATQTSVASDDANAPVVTSIDYRDTGVILKVSPQIGAGGTLTLDIEQEVSSVQTTSTSGIDSPSFRQRQITTSVLLSDGATLVLGGLVQESDNRTETRVPGLGEVPFLGAAFRNRGSERDRTELLILIRPRIIRDAQDAAEYTAELRGQMAGANGALSTGLGDPRHTLDDLFR